MAAHSKKNWLLGGVSALIAATATSKAALAQVTDANTTATEDAFALETIVVTARRQEEDLQQTPIAVTAFTGEALQERGFVDNSQIARITPNVVFDGAAPVSGNSAAPSVFIRGVGQLDFTVNADPGVGIYVDGVYVARSVGGIIDLLDVERVEVLRGPQGTLFGRNTIGGAIQLVSQKPTTDGFEGYLQATTGSDNRIDVQGSLNVPLGDTLAAKVSGITRNRDGYVKNATGQDLGNDDTYSIRGQLLWEPTDRLSVHIIADYTKDNENGAPNVALTAFPNGNFPGVRYNMIPGFGCGAPAVPQLPNGDLDTSDSSYAAYLAFIDGNANCFDLSDITGTTDTTNSTTFALSQNEIFGISGTLEFDLGWGALKSITAHRTLESSFQRDSDHTAFSIFDTINGQDQDQFSQEFTLSGDTDNFNWLVGAYYFEEDATGDLNVILPAAGGPVIIRGIFNNEISNENLAFFGEATYGITDRLRLTGGLRYTEEDKDYSTLQLFTLAELPPGPSLALTNFRLVRSLPDGFPKLVTLVDDPGQSLSVSETNLRMTVAYDLTDDVFAYFSYSDGFKSGGFNPRYLAPTSDGLAIAYDPEFVEMFELGLKSDLFDKRLRLNLAVFMMSYTDIQVSASTAASSGARIFQNAAEAGIDGFEVEFQFVPDGNFLIEGSLGYLDASFDSFGTLANLNCLPNCEFARIPEWTSSLGISYAYDLSGGGEIKSRVDCSYKSSVQGDANNAPEIEHPSQNIVNAGITYTDPGENWLLSAGVTNLTDEEYIVSSNNNPRLSYSEAIFARERQWFLSVRRNF